MIYYLIKYLSKLYLRLYLGAKVIGAEKVPNKGPLIIASNHTSVLDPLMVGAMVNRKVHYMAKEELFPNALAAWFMRSIAVFPVARGKGDRAAIKRALELLAEGKVMGIFPEGTRSEDGSLGKAQPGTAMLVAKSGASVLTVACIGTFKAYPRGARLPKRVKVELRIGDILTPSDLGLARDEESDDRKDNRRRADAAGEIIMASIGRLLNK